MLSFFLKIWAICAVVKAVDQGACSERSLVAVCADIANRVFEDARLLSEAEVIQIRLTQFRMFNEWERACSPLGGSVISHTHTHCTRFPQITTRTHISRYQRTIHQTTFLTMRAKNGSSVFIIFHLFVPAVRCIASLLTVQGIDRREGDVDGTAQDREGTEEGEGSKQGSLRQQNVPPRWLCCFGPSQPNLKLVRWLCFRGSKSSRAVDRDGGNVRGCAVSKIESLPVAPSWEVMVLMYFRAESNRRDSFEGTGLCGTERRLGWVEFSPWLCSAVLEVLRLKYHVRSKVEPRSRLTFETLLLLLPFRLYAGVPAMKTGRVGWHEKLFYKMLPIAPNWAPVTTMTYDIKRHRRSNEHRACGTSTNSPVPNMSQHPWKSASPFVSSPGS